MEGHRPGSGTHRLSGDGRPRPSRPSEARQGLRCARAGCSPTASLSSGVSSHQASRTLIEHQTAEGRHRAIILLQVLHAHTLASAVTLERIRVRLFLKRAAGPGWRLRRYAPGCPAWAGHPTFWIANVWRRAGEGACATRAYESSTALFVARIFPATRRNFSSFSRACRIPQKMLAVALGSARALSMGDQFWRQS